MAGGYTEIGNRQADLETLYSTKDWIRASEAIRQYGIRYIYVGGLSANLSVDETKFVDNLKLAFESGDVRIYGDQSLMNDNFEQMTENLFLSLERYWLIWYGYCSR